MVESKIFKAYDIRGIYPQQLNEETALIFGKAFAVYTQAKRVAVGMDMRASSILLREKLVEGLTSQGVDVVLIGTISTPILSFAVGSDDSIEAGIMITASHNPSQYNGFKMMRGDMSPICQNAGMEEIRDLCFENKFIDNEKLGNVTEVSVLDAYIEKLLSLVDVTQFKDLSVVIDAGNGVNGPIIQKILDKIPQITVHKLYFEPDGTFPNHEANPLDHETLKDLYTEVRAENADFGIAFDGDGDRIGVMDETGTIIPGDLLLALLAQYLLQKTNKKGEKVLFDLRSSCVVQDVVAGFGGETEETKVGRSFIIRDVQEKNALLAGELSCHFYYREFYGVESADLTLLYLLDLLSQENRPLSEVVAPLRKYYQSGEINFEVEEKQAVMEKVAALYKEIAQEIHWLDGLKVICEDYWFNIRPSNTEPVLRLNIEAQSEEKLHEVRDSLIEVING